MHVPEYVPHKDVLGKNKKTVTLLSMSVSTCIGHFNSMSVDSHLLAALGKDDGERDRGGNCEENL